MGVIYFKQQIESDERENEILDVGSLTHLDYKFRVHFRRPVSYMGEYGFDWYQDEFQTCTTPDKLKKEYRPCEILNQEYLIPWMSIKKGHRFKVNLAIEEFEGTPCDQDIIKLKPQKGIKFYPDAIKVVDVINNTINHFPSGQDVGTEITIECTDNIPEDMGIEVHNKNDEVIGKLSFLKNDKEYKLPIRIVLLLRKGYETVDENSIISHLTTNVDSDFNGLPDLSSCMQKLENEMNYYAFNQAFVVCEMEKNKSNDVIFHKTTIDESDWINKGYINGSNKIVDRSDLNSDLLNLYKSQVEKGSSGTGFFKGVIIVITHFEGDKLAGKGNLNIIDDRNCILFHVDSATITTQPDGAQSRTVPSGNIKMKTYIHEVGHVLSLTHPFQIFDKKKIQQNEKFIIDMNNYMNNPKVSQTDKDSTWSIYKNTYKQISRDSYLYYRNKYFLIGNGTEQSPEKGSTKCLFMDYAKDRKVYTQWQWRVIQESVIKYFSSKR